MLVLFVATAYEKRASMMYEKNSSNGGIIVDNDNKQSTMIIMPECKSLMNKALESYADALRPLKFKYDNNVEETGGGAGKMMHSTTIVRPDI